MSEAIGKELILVFRLFGAEIKVDILILIMSWIAIAIILVGALVLRRGLNLKGDLEVEGVPSRRQSFLELLVEGLRTQLGGGFESEQLANRLFPLLATLGIYVLTFNWLSIIPGLRSPTESINIPVSLGLMVFFLAHYYKIRLKGPLGYLREYGEPWMLFPLSLVLNAVGELAKPLSHSFRLFGNLLGGAILLSVIAGLIPLWVFPLHVFLNFFYVLFVGAIQAMVFTLLAVAYISLAEG